MLFVAPPAIAALGKITDKFMMGKIIL